MARIQNPVDLTPVLASAWPDFPSSARGTSWWDKLGRPALRPPIGFIIYAVVEAAPISTRMVDSNEFHIEYTNGDGTTHRGVLFLQAPVYKLFAPSDPFAVISSCEMRVHYATLDADAATAYVGFAKINDDSTNIAEPVVCYRITSNIDGVANCDLLANIPGNPSASVNLFQGLPNNTPCDLLLRIEKDTCHVECTRLDTDETIVRDLAIPAGTPTGMALAFWADLKVNNAAWKMRGWGVKFE